MLQDERFIAITNYLKLHNIARINEMVQLTGASVDTVRRDLEALETKGILKRVHGGAVYEGESITRQSYGSREIKNKQEKKELAGYVLDYIKEDQSIALNSGTTNIEVGIRIAEAFDRLTIITNSLRIVQAMAHKKSFTFIIPGGVLNNEELSIHGSDCEKAIMQYNIDLAILAVNAVSIEKGVTDFRLDEVGIIKAMMGNTRKNLLAVDSSKFDRISFINVCPLDQVQMIVTDSRLNEDVSKIYKEHVAVVSSFKIG